MASESDGDETRIKLPRSPLQAAPLHTTTRRFRNPMSVPSNFTSADDVLGSFFALSTYCQASARIPENSPTQGLRDQQVKGLAWTLCLSKNA